MINYTFYHNKRCNFLFFFRVKERGTFLDVKTFYEDKSGNDSADGRF